MSWVCKDMRCPPANETLSVSRGQFHTHVHLGGGQEKKKFRGKKKLATWMKPHSQKAMQHQRVPRQVKNSSPVGFRFHVTSAEWNINSGFLPFGRRMKKGERTPNGV